MKYIVTASSMNLSTNNVSQSWKEIIDTETNTFFNGCTSKDFVSQRYESFWNTPCVFNEIVRVLTVTESVE